MEPLMYWMNNGDSTLSADWLIDFFFSFVHTFAMHCFLSILAEHSCRASWTLWETRSRELRKGTQILFVCKCYVCKDHNIVENLCWAVSELAWNGIVGTRERNLWYLVLQSSASISNKWALKADESLSSHLRVCQRFSFAWFVLIWHVFALNNS